jgi:hypothetical protein
MASRYTSALKDVYVTVTNRSAVTGLVLGAGLYYAISNEKYTHIPLVVIMPNVYAGYHGLKCISEVNGLECIRELNGLECSIGKLDQSLNDALNALEKELKKLK